MLPTSDPRSAALAQSQRHLDSGVTRNARVHMLKTCTRAPDVESSGNGGPAPAKTASAAAADAHMRTLPVRSGLYNCGIALPASRRASDLRVSRSESYDADNVDVAGLVALIAGYCRDRV